MKKSFMEDLKEILWLIVAILVIALVGGAMFYHTYLEYDTKIKIHETYKNAADRIGAREAE